MHLFCLLLNIDILLVLDADQIKVPENVEAQIYMRPHS